MRVVISTVRVLKAYVPMCADSNDIWESAFVEQAGGYTVTEGLGVWSPTGLPDDEVDDEVRVYECVLDSMVDASLFDHVAHRWLLANPEEACCLYTVQDEQGTQSFTIYRK